MSHVKMNKLTGARARERAGQLARMSFLTPEMDSTSKTTYVLIYHMKKLNKLTGARVRTSDLTPEMSSPPSKTPISMCILSIFK